MITKEEQKRVREMPDEKLQDAMIATCNAVMQSNFRNKKSIEYRSYLINEKKRRGLIN